MDYAMYDPVLAIVKSTLSQLTGMTLNQFFTNELARMAHTAEFSLGQLAQLIYDEGDEESVVLVGKLGERLNTFLKDRAEVAEAAAEAKKVEKMCQKECN
jgi:predicted DNA-binding ribbon-helix-helix protein